MFNNWTLQYDLAYAVIYKQSKSHKHRAAQTSIYLTHQSGSDWSTFQSPSSQSLVVIQSKNTALMSHRIAKRFLSGSDICIIVQPVSMCSVYLHIRFQNREIPEFTHFNYSNNKPSSDHRKSFEEI